MFKRDNGYEPVWLRPCSPIISFTARHGTARGEGWRVCLSGRGEGKAARSVVGVLQLLVVVEQFGISDSVAGSTVLAVGGSAGKLCTVMMSVFVTNNDIGIATVLGSAVYGFIVIIGTCSFFAKSESIRLQWCAPLQRVQPAAAAAAAAANPLSPLFRMIRCRAGSCVQSFQRRRIAGGRSCAILHGSLSRSLC